MPAWWLPGAHAQTVGARLTRARRGVTLTRERLDLPDGDFVDLDWAGRREDALVLVLHGLEGSARSKYALEIYRQLAHRGVAAVGLNFRSCSGELNRGRRLYHSGETEDTRYVLRVLRERFPDRPIGAVGVSLGGNVLLKYLGEEGRRVGVGAGGSGAIPVAAAVLSVPYDLSAGADYLERGFARVYARRLLRSLKVKVRARADELGSLLDVPRALAARTFWEFDDAATAPLHGFASAEEYYRRSSSKQFLADIAIPTRLIHATDDPFLPATALPYDAIRANSLLDAHITDRGGHVGFVTGHPWSRRYWGEEMAVIFVSSHLTASLGAQHGS